MDVTSLKPSPIESLVTGDSRVATALWEENYGPPAHRYDYLMARLDEAGYDTRGAQWQKMTETN